MEARRINKKIVVLLVFYCLIRLPILLSPWEILHEETYLGGQFHRGLMAKEWIEGPRLSLWDYLTESYAAGELMAGLWTAPFFILFGPTAFSLKLAPFCWHLLALVLWYFIFKKHFTERQTFLMLLFLCLPPPQITRYMLFNLGFHFEMILWMALSILIFQSFLEGRLSPAKGGLLLGVLGGFSSFLILTHLLTVAVMGLYLILFRGNVRKGRFALFYSAGFCAAFSPWIFYAASLKKIGWSSAKKLFYFFSPEKPLSHFGKGLFDLFFNPNAGFQGLFGLQAGLGLIVVLVFIVALFLLCKRNRHFLKEQRGTLNLQVFGGIFQGLLMLLVLLHRDAVLLNYYLFPMVPFMGMTMATLSQRRWIQKSLLVFFVALGLVGNLNRISFADLGATLKMRGYSYDYLMGVLYAKYSKDFLAFREKFVKALRHRPEADQRIFYQLFDQRVFDIKTPLDTEKYIPFIQTSPKEFQPILYERLGMQLMAFVDYQPSKLKELFAALNLPVPTHPSICRGALRMLAGTDFSLRQKIKIGHSLTSLLPKNAKPLCYEGLGLVELDILALSKDWHWVSSQLERSFRSYYLRGLGEQMTEELWEHPKNIFSFVNLLRFSEREWFLEGLKRGISGQENIFIQSKLKATVASLSK